VPFPGFLEFVMSTIPPAGNPPSEAALVRTLQIIVFALAMGVVMFAAIVVSQSGNRPQRPAGNTPAWQSPVFLVGVATLLLGFIVPAIIFAAGRKAAARAGGERANSDAASRLAIQQQVHQTTIIGCAILEGGAFLGLVSYMQSGDTTFLALAGLGLVGILSYFPTPGRFERRVENELRRLKEQQMLAPMTQCKIER
jgi:hypothetical protein